VYHCNSLRFIRHHPWPNTIHHRSQVKALEAQLEGREREVQALQMALHHCEMDVVRMRVVVDSVAQVGIYILERCSRKRGWERIGI